MCASEFIIDDEICPAAWSGDISTMYEEWKGKVESIRVYQKKLNMISLKIYILSLENLMILKNLWNQHLSRYLCILTVNFKFAHL